MNYSFQTDSELINSAYNDANFLIEIDESASNEYCALYFSSHDIYFPNTEEAFNQRIVKKNFFEWYKTRFPGVRKHIFLRDIKKQWYQSGINSTINSLEKLLNFLEGETQGFKIFAIGSSAGGYAATLFGNMLGADKIINFNGQSDLEYFLRESTETENPLLFRNQNSEFRKYYSITSFLPSVTPNTFYFFSEKSIQDLPHFHKLKTTKATLIGFNTSHHGIPFLKCSLDKVLSKSNAELVSLSHKHHHPLIFSIRQSGITTVFKFLIQISIQQFQRRLKKGMRS